MNNEVPAGDLMFSTIFWFFTPRGGEVVCNRHMKRRCHCEFR